MNLIFKNLTLLSEIENVKLLEVRNSKNIRKNMNNQDYIKLESHKTWLNKLEKDDENIYYAVFYEDKIVGGISVTKICKKENICTWGLYFKEDINVFISSISTYLLIEKIFFELKIQRLNLEVKKDNLAAYKFDKSFGFEDYSQLEDSYLMYMDEKMWKNKKESFLINTLKKKIAKIDYKFIEG